MYEADSVDPKKSAPKQLVFDNTSGIDVSGTILVFASNIVVVSFYGSAYIDLPGVKIGGIDMS